MAILFHDDLAWSGLKDKRKIKSWIVSFSNKENRGTGDINIIFLDDEKLRKINIEYLSRDYYTDIITFDYSEGSILSGDIFISVERVKENAERFNVDRNSELLRVIIHGILHLIGYTDTSDSEKQKMRLMEDKCLIDY